MYQINKFKSPGFDTVRNLLMCCCLLLPLLLSAQPLVVQGVQNVTEDPYGVGFGNFNDWLDNNGNAIVTTPAGCTPVTWTNNYDYDNWNFNCSNWSGSISVTFFYEDACGFSLSLTGTYTLIDETDPTCAKPQDLFLDCADDPVTTIQNYIQSQPVTDLSVPISITSDFDPADIDQASDPEGLTINITFTDACGNSVVRDFTVFITGDMGGAPVLSGVPADVTVNCDNVPGPSNTVTASNGMGITYPVSPNLEI